MTKLQDFLNSDLKAVAPMGRKVRAGDLFGIEIECEGKNVGPYDDAVIGKDWVPHKDGSLRENHGSSCEWVFNGPVTYVQSVERVNNLFDFLEQKKAKFVCSNRTSVHVHFNMGDKKTYQLVNLYILFTVLEDLLDSYCGEDRNGNLFCLSSRHAEAQLDWMNRACFLDYGFMLNNDQRYTSLNLASLHKFGTVEFRGMRGLDNREDMLKWLKILNEFVNYACYKMQNPVTIIENISLKSPVGFLADIFTPETLRDLTKDKTADDINRSIYEGMRLIQMFSYKIGTEFDGVRLQGKDFWASLSDRVEPVLDVNPEDIEVFEEAPRPRARRGLALNQINVLPPLARGAWFLNRDAEQVVDGAAGRQRDLDVIEEMNRAVAERARILQLARRDRERFNILNGEIDDDF